MATYWVEEDEPKPSKREQIKRLTERLKEAQDANRRAREYHEAEIAKRDVELARAGLVRASSIEVMNANYDPVSEARLSVELNVSAAVADGLQQWAKSAGVR